MELDLRILQNETNFKDLEKKIFKIVCKQALEALKKLLEKIDQVIMESRDKDKFKLKDIKKRIIDTLFVEADGIHISLQKDDKEKGELKLGMSYQGWEKRHPMSDEYNLTGKKHYWSI